MNRRQFIGCMAGACAHLPLAGGALAKSSLLILPGQDSMAKLKKKVVEAALDNGAIAVGITDATKPYKHADRSRPLPREVWRGAKSVINMAFPNVPVQKKLSKSELRKLKRMSPRERAQAGGVGLPTINPKVVTIVPPTNQAIIRLLHRRGYEVRGPGEMQLRLSAYYAGIGLYGKSGLLLHKTFGNRMAFYHLLTDAKLPPDKPIPKSKDYRTCDDCGKCVDTCPGEAHDKKKKYPDAYNIRKCVKSREKVLLEEGKLCQNCLLVCPFAKKTDKEIEKLYR